MTSTEAVEAKVLKTDELGRVRTPAERREHLLDEFERSGLSGAKFAALAGIKYPTFAGWLHRRRRQGGGEAPNPGSAGGTLRWLEAVLDDANAPSRHGGTGVVLEFPGGARLVITDVAQVTLAVAIVQAVAKPC